MVPRRRRIHDALMHGGRRATGYTEGALFRRREKPMALRMDDPLVARALLFAVERHKDHKDRAGRPYVGHLIRVAEKVEGARAQAAALLHDSVEDRKATAEEIAREFPEVRDLVTMLTHTDDEGYTEYILRVSKD